MIWEGREPGDHVPDTKKRSSSCKNLIYTFSLCHWSIVRVSRTLHTYSSYVSFKFSTSNIYIFWGKCVSHFTYATQILKIFSGLQIVLYTWPSTFKSPFIRGFKKLASDFIYFLSVTWGSRKEQQVPLSGPHSG